MKTSEGPNRKPLKNKGVSVKELPKARVSGPILLGGAELDCYVLEDGTAVLNKGKMMKAIGRQWKGASRTERPNFIGAKNLQPFISEELDRKLEGLDFADNGRIISGYEADTLPLVCDTYLQARAAGVLTPSQEPIAQMCEILVRSFARVGIIALIYEQLGFEKFKHPDALRILIESYLADEVRKWTKEFPDEFFAQMDKIYGHERTTSRNRPKYYAKFINKHIYDPLEQGRVLTKLKEVNPTNSKGNRKNRFHSHLSEEIGLPAVRQRIWEVNAVMKISPNKRKFEGLYAKLTGQSYQTEAFDDDLQD
ncbi:MAG: P63C domain-containing protein [Candidatus Kapaibacterium sp.]